MKAATSGRLAINGTVEVFEAHRRRLFGVAYRMLGSRADAEDLVQDVYLRWHQSAAQAIRSPVAFLLTITTRLCLDRIRELKQEHGRCVAAWMPELIADDHVPSPEMQAELTDEISAAILALLERLGSEERAAFLLHEVFDCDYREVAQMCGKAEPACRQMICRARSRVRESRPRFSVSAQSRERILAGFLAAAKSGDRTARHFVARGGSRIFSAAARSFALRSPCAGGDASPDTAIASEETASAR